MTREWNRITPRGIELSQGTAILKTISAILAVAALALVASSSAEAKGCLKGAVVGGVAGHYAGHHGWLGAATGCLYGRYRARQQQEQQQAPRQHEHVEDNGQNGM
jgi:hypothetical protein